MSSKRPPAPPPHIPGFKYVSLLGSGGFSDVFLYEQDRPRRKVAIKVLLSDLKTEGARRRFESEANLMAQLSSHPYIVTIFEAEVTDDGHSYLAMEYCSRPSLDVRYRRQRFSVDEVLAVGIQVASAVETAHRAGIAHRDIKPANILVTDYNRPALTDFGISGTIGAEADDDAGMSIPWSPPEQFRGSNVSGVLVDVWALGATLYTLLAGRSPFVLPGQDNSQRELIARITNAPLPRLGRADVPESLELVLATAMAKAPGSRYSSAHAFALALQRIQAELNLSVTPFEVLEEPHSDDGHPDDGFEETRVRGIASIDPEAKGTATTGTGPTFPARTFPDTRAEPARPEPARAEPARPEPARTGPARPGPASLVSPPPEPALPEPAVEESSSTVLKSRLPAHPTVAAVDALYQDPDERTVLRGTKTAEAEFAATTIGRSAAPRPGGDKADGLGADVESRPVDHRHRNLWLAATGAAVLLIAIVVGIVLAAGSTPKAQETEEPSRPPVDALDSGNVPDVEALTGSRTGAGKAVFTWKNPQPKDGDSFKWRIKTARGEGSYVSISANQVEVSENPAEPTCVQVIIVRSDGAASPEGEGSIACLAAQ
ncbi:serine/threonine-protein kinase [Arthrobacter sp. ISL-30]|uniref:serine/threonine-protein kinase n=1 Tax=Arthrobacter sp. ISL-30 TaxID=2819109 RepID=UPI001BE9A538|nr:serine/threonine-protein kinase [Arthrobacter sp. ISL-30]MBT2514098.1 protein kinase [Arthrobacter sp. ISL-30]